MNALVIVLRGLNIILFVSAVQRQTQRTSFSSLVCWRSDVSYKTKRSVQWLPSCLLVSTTTAQVLVAVGEWTQRFRWLLSVLLSWSLHIYLFNILLEYFHSLLESKNHLGSEKTAKQCLASLMDFMLLNQKFILLFAFLTLWSNCINYLNLSVIYVANKKMRFFCKINT